MHVHSYQAYVLSSIRAKELTNTNVGLNPHNLTPNIYWPLFFLRSKWSGIEKQKKGLSYKNGRILYILLGQNKLEAIFSYPRLFLRLSQYSWAAMGLIQIGPAVTVFRLWIFCRCTTLKATTQWPVIV